MLPVSPQSARDAELIAEAKLLRQHKGRLEARMQILEDHNKQLESQLHRLRQLLEQVINTVSLNTPNTNCELHQRKEPTHKDKFNMAAMFQTGSAFDLPNKQLSSKPIFPY